MLNCPTASVATSGALFGVLHVDDDPYAREIIALSVGGDPTVSVRSCESGHEALAAVATWPPDLILLDVEMPDLDGPAILARLRERPETAAVPVIYTTTTAIAGRLGELPFPVAGVIIKPFDPAALPAQLNRLLSLGYRKLAARYYGLEENALLDSGIVFSSQDAVIAKNLDGTILSWNTGAQNMFDYSAEEAIGRSIRMLIPDELCAQEEFIMSEIQGGRAVDHFETVRLAKGGRRVHISLRVSPVYNRSGRLVGASKVARDISEQQRLIAALQRSDERHRQVISGMTVGVWDWDLADGEYFWSHRLKEILGHGPDFVPSREDFESRLHPDDRARVIAAFQRHLGERAPYDIEYRLRKAGGDYIWLHATCQAVWNDAGQAVRIVGSIDDISPRKQAEEELQTFKVSLEVQVAERTAELELARDALRKEATRLLTVTNTISDGLITLDDQGAIQTFNPAASRIFGYAPESAIGQNLRLLLFDPPASLAEIGIVPDETEAAGNEPAGVLELSGKRCDGQRFPMEIAVTAMRVEGIRSLVCTVRDVSERRAEAQKREALIKKLTASNKQLDDFAYAASHDLRSPLRVIDNAAKWLQQDLEPHLGPETRTHLQLLRSRVARLEKLLDDLLRYAQAGRESASNTLIDGTELIDGLLAKLRYRNTFKVTATGFDTIRVAPVPLRAILMDLIDNAIRHHDKASGQIDITAEDLGGRHAFSVSDDGPGIPQRYHGKIFEMFQTLKPRDQVEGSGMGLAIARKHVEMCGGEMTVESSEGRGTTFRFNLPAPEQNLSRDRDQPE
jgi:PAS domain S-box-containing protein